MISRSICNLKIDTICPICMCDIPFDRSILQLSNGIRHVLTSTDRKLELTAKASMAQPVSQPAVCSNGLKSDKNNGYLRKDQHTFFIRSRSVFLGMRKVSESRCRKYKNILSFMS
jgi:hypothetical protein